MSEARMILVVVLSAMGGAVLGMAALTLCLVARGARFVEYVIVWVDRRDSSVIARRPIESTKPDANGSVWN